MIHETTLTRDDRLGLQFAAECVGDLLAERHDLELLLQTLAQKLHEQAPHAGACRALLTAARFYLANLETPGELRDVIKHLASRHPVAEVGA